jgi:DNA-binding NtrC family response regulator
LNERISDIPILVDYFLKLISVENNNKLKKIESNAVKKLQNFNWTGNVRELRNVIERLLILSENSIITIDDVINYSGKK